MKANLKYLCLLALFFIGCTTTEYRRNISLDYALDGNKDVGLIIGSATISMNNRQPPNDSIEAYYDINTHDGKKTVTISSIRPVNVTGTVFANMLLFWTGRGFTIRESSQFSGENGQVFTMELPAGKYKIAKWRTEANRQVHQSNYETFPPIDFTVRKGEIIYIGSIHMNVSGVGGIFNLNSAKVEIQDKTKRDLRIFKKQFTKLAHEKIHMNILKTTR